MKVKIDKLTFNAIIGILPFEREHKQKVIVGISFKYTFDDKDQNFIDYSEVAKIVEKSLKVEAREDTNEEA